MTNASILDDTTPRFNTHVRNSTPRKEWGRKMEELDGGPV